MTRNKAVDAVLAVVRGEKSLSSLKDVGVRFEKRSVDREAHVRQLIVKHKTQLSVQPTAGDLACGLLRYRNQPKELSEWGSFILAADIVDLGPLEMDANGDALLGGVWDASFEGRVSEKVVAAAESLAAPNL
jgi:hypothetical protein